jgi:hypothetical protein
MALLGPVAELMHERLLLTRVIRTAEVPVNRRSARPGRTTKAHQWVGIARM